jgi:asparagine synthase (glutamine-hydrolysing)
MCGISGIASGAPVANAMAHIARMNAALAHRGPDGEDSWEAPGIALGHRRLSIIDVSERGRQPMTNRDGSLALVCNGEIYNFRDLRRAFSDYPFTSDTDVEVILPLYERYGARCVEHLVGMFAFALWDGRARRLLLARDRVGEKPLYYSESGGTLAFSSELKGLLTLPWVDRRLDEAAIPLMLVHSALPAPATIYRGARLLPPASILMWQDGRARVERYWQIDFSRRKPWRWPDAVAAYGDVVGTAVEGSLVADVPLGLMLSGGVDSSTVAALAVRRNAAIESFCLGSEADGVPDEEFVRAAEAGRLLGTRHHNIGYDEPSLGELPAMLAQFDQPMSCMTVLYVDRLAQVMARHQKVVLSGNGADEVFAGYRTYAALGLRQMLHRCARPFPVGLARLLPEPWRARAERLMHASHHPMATRRGAAFSALADGLLARLCHPDFAARWRGADAGRAIAAAGAECNPESPIDATIYSDLMVYHQHGHAILPDICGMRYGLEIRSPFLDHRVIEFAASLPATMLIPSPLLPSRTKEIEKRWLATVLPRSFVYQRKVGFGDTLDLERQFRGPWAPGVTRLLRDGRYLELGIFHRAGAEWALAHSFEAMCVLLSFAVWAELALFGETPHSLGERLAGGGDASAAQRRAAAVAGA